MRTKQHQTKDIPDEVFLDAIRASRRIVGLRAQPSHFGWVGRWEVEEYLNDHGYPWVNDKLTTSKARSLMNRGIIDGCGCGCRGDYEIVAEKGLILGPRRMDGGL